MNKILIPVMYPGCSNNKPFFDVKEHLSQHQQSEKQTGINKSTYNKRPHKKNKGYGATKGVGVMKMLSNDVPTSK